METTSLTFGSPLWLWGLCAIPLFAGLLVWAEFHGRRLVSKVVAPRLRDQLAGSVSQARRILRAVLFLATFALVLIALAQPRRGFIQTEIKSKGRDVLIAVDTSRSMLATDVAPDRLTRAKLLTQDFVRLLRGDRVGLIAFAGSAFLQAPLTLDYSAVVNALDELDTSVIPKGGTNIAAAISCAEDAFGKAEGQTRALIILTDGEELDADGVAAAKRARELGIRIFTVGIGSPEGSLIPIRADEGKQDFVRDSDGKPVQSRLDTSRLGEIAEATGGFFAPLGPDAAKEIFQRGIEPMDQSETGVLASRQPLEQYQWPLGFAIGFLILWLLLGDRRKLRNGVRPALAAILLAVPASHAATTGLDNYNMGDFQGAQKDFESRLKQSPNSRELQFNAGASAYKLGDFPQAIAHFTESLLSEDKKLREDASYNLANSLVRRGEAAKDNTAKKADWKSAIEHYDETLRLDPKNKPAQENRDIVKKLLEDLEKQEQQQKDQQQDKQDQKDKKDDQKKDQDKQNQQDQNKDQQQQDQQDKKDQQDQKDQQNQKDQRNQKDQQDQKNGGKDDQKKDSDQKDQQNQNDQKDRNGEKENDKQDQNKDQDKTDGQDKQDKKDSKGNQNPENKPSDKGQQQPAAPTPTPGEKKQGDVRAANESDQKPDKPEKDQAAAPAEEEEREGQMSAAQARGLLNALRSEEEKVNLIPQQTSQDVLRDW
jgi:Ca-activated chloride channel family protein